MEKLIELLNEYEPYIQSDGTHTYNLWGNAYQGHSAIFPKELAESYIISARYGFIKWLVENNKVDLKKANNIDNGPLFDYYSDEDALIMALSINDEPLKFLESILK